MDQPKRSRKEERARARARRRRLVPFFEELLDMSDGEFIELMLSAADKKASIRFDGDEDTSAWGKLDLTGPLEGVWSSLKEAFEFSVSADTSCDELVNDDFTRLKIDKRMAGSDMTYGDLERLICAQIKQHPDDKKN
jgi:hypothetical protein